MSRRLPEYDSAYAHVIGAILESFVSADPVLSELAGRLEPTAHRGPIRNVRGPTQLDQPLERVEAVARLADVDSTQMIRGTDIDLHTALLRKLGESYVETVARLLFDSIGRVSEAAGTSVDAKKRPLSWDIVVETLSRMELDFDEQGKLRDLRFVLHPDDFASLGNPTPAQAERLNAVLVRKQQEHAAKKRNRRLSRQPRQ
jgi:hypothetical protein